MRVAAATKKGCQLPMTCHVIVVGAGIAGLSAGGLLKRAGCAVTILEARSRIGGRIHTSHVWPDVPVDLGASWIHGVNSNPLTALAQYGRPS